MDKYNLEKYDLKFGEIKFGHIQSAIWTNKLAIWTDTIDNLQFEYEVKDIYVLDFKLLVCFFIKYSGTNLLLQRGI